jgi:RES domain-containing protein
MKLYRIGSRAFPVFDGTGAFLKGGRWNDPGRHVIYCAENLSSARLELLVHLGRMTGRPANHAFVEIDVPDATYGQAQVISDPPSDWDHPTDHSAARAIGNPWFDNQTALILRAPSVASHGEFVVAINQRHPDFALIEASGEKPLVRDSRLFE